MTYKSYDYPRSFYPCCCWHSGWYGYNPNRYPNYGIEHFGYYPAQLLLSTRQRTVSLQNQGDSPFKNWYLDIDGNTGALMLSERLVSGAYWELTDQGNGTVSLQNLGNSRFKNWYLDIDGNTGALMLSERLVSGAHWKLNDHGAGRVSLQNLGNSRFKNWYLDIDGNTGALMLSERLVSGAFWSLTTHAGSDTPPGVTPDGGLGGTPAGKKGWEIKLGQITWKEPYTYECTWHVGPIETTGVCQGMQEKGVDYYFGLTYPDTVNLLEEQVILNCASIAAEEGYGPLVAAVATAGPAGVVAAAAALPVANNVAKEALKLCLEASTLSSNIINNVEGFISQRRR